MSAYVPAPQAKPFDFRRDTTGGDLELYVFDKFVCSWGAHVKPTDPCVMEAAIKAAYDLGCINKMKQIKEVLGL